MRADRADRPSPGSAENVVEAPVPTADAIRRESPPDPVPDAPSAPSRSRAAFREHANAAPARTAHDDTRPEPQPEAVSPAVAPVSALADATAAPAPTWQLPTNPFLTYEAMRRATPEARRDVVVPATKPASADPPVPGAALAARLSSVTSLVTQGIDIARPSASPDDTSQTTLSAGADVWPFRLKIQGRFR